MIGRMRSWLNDPVVTPTMAKAFVIAVAGAAVAAPFAAVEPERKSITRMYLCALGFYLIAVMLFLAMPDLSLPGPTP